LIAGNPDSVAKQIQSQMKQNRRGSFRWHVPHRQLGARQSRQLAQSFQKRDHAAITIAGRLIRA
jgi:hypothetical protein